MKLISSTTTVLSSMSFSELEIILREKALIKEGQKLDKVMLETDSLILTLIEETAAGELINGRTFTEDQKKALETPFDDLDISVRALNCIKAAKIGSLKELVGYKESDILKFRNFGHNSLKEIKEVLAEKGLSLRPE